VSDEKLWLIQCREGSGRQRDGLIKPKAGGATGPQKKNKGHEKRHAATLGSRSNQYKIKKGGALADRHLQTKTREKKEKAKRGPTERF